MKRHCVFIAAFLVCSVVTGCAYSWTKSKPLANSFDDVWETTYGVIARRYDIASASIEDRSIETNWKQHLSIMYLKGYRTKVYAEIKDYVPTKEEELEEGVPLGNTPEEGVEDQKPAKQVDAKREKKYIIRIQVQKDQNRNADNPSLPEDASWFPVGTDPQEEQMLLDFIMARLTFKRTTKPANGPKENSDEMSVRP